VPRLGGVSPVQARTEPTRWAYALREAVALAGPDVLVSHWDPKLEADALRAGIGPGDDWVDQMLAAPALAQAPPTIAAVELVGLLAGLYRSGLPIAAAVSGPVTVAAALAQGLLGASPAAGDRVELAELCADALAALIAAYGDAGASIVLVVEHHTSLLAGADAAGVHSPLLRAIAHQRLSAVLLAPDGFGGSIGYEAVATRWDGSGPPPAVAAIDAGLWALPPEQFAERWRELKDGGATAGVLLLSDGPLPAAMPLENLQAR
jgi:hypothetical protein